MTTKNRITSEEEVIKTVNQKEKSRYWVAVMYPESMIPDWQEKIGDILQFPFEYCIHNKDLENPKDLNSKPRKTHVHIILAYPNPTTYKNVLSMFKKLGSCNYVESVKNIKSKHDYLIHDTETARKNGKHLYDISERVTENNFDIGAYIQLSKKDKNDMKLEIKKLIWEKRFFDFYELEKFVYDNLDTSYQCLLDEYGQTFERTIKGMYNHYVRMMNGENKKLRAFLEEYDKKQEQAIKEAKEIAETKENH